VKLFFDDENSNNCNDKSEHYYSKKTLLEAFDNEVKNKLYKGLKYSDWRTLLHTAKTLIIDVDSNFNSRVCYTAQEDSYPRFLNCYNPHDGSFGQFLYDRIIKEYQNHIKNTANTTSTYTTTTTSNNSNNVISNSSILNNNKTITTDTCVISDSSALNTNIGTISNAYIKTGDTWSEFNTATINTAHSFSNLAYSFSNLKDEIKKQVLDEINKKEVNKMSEMSKMFNFDFGPVNDNHYRMSPYGLAIDTSKNGWIAYDSLSGELINVEIFNFSIKNLLYKMPAAIETLNAGDIIIHSSRPVFVKGINKDGTIKVISYDGAVVMDILPIKSPFGFSFATKIVSLIDFSQIKADPKNPFGNMLPFLMMGDREGEDLDFLPFLMMNQGQDFMNNPMMMYALMSGNKSNNKDLFLMMMLMNQKGDNIPHNKTEKVDN